MTIGIVIFMSDPFREKGICKQRQDSVSDPFREICLCIQRQVSVGKLTYIHSACVKYDNTKSSYIECHVSLCNKT